MVPGILARDSGIQGGATDALEESLRDAILRGSSGAAASVADGHAFAAGIACGRCFMNSRHPRDAVIDLLAFPRLLARDGIALEQCHHGGNFSPKARDCAVCASRMECEWLFHADEFSALASRPLADVVDALRFATVYVESRRTMSVHAPGRCGCDACQWLERANTLLGESG